MRSPYWVMSTSRKGASALCLALGTVWRCLGFSGASFLASLAPALPSVPSVASFSSSLSSSSSSSSSAATTTGKSLTFCMTATKKPPVFWWCGSILMQRSRWNFSASSAVGGKQVSAMRKEAFLGRSKCFSYHSPSEEIFQVLMPGARLRSGSSLETSTSSMTPSQRRRISATTASFSTGLKEQVLYTMRPPMATSCVPRCAILICSLCSENACLVDQRPQRSGLLRRVPSPLHGTSASTLSNLNLSPARGWPSGYLRPGRRWASWLVTTTLGVARRFIWWTSM
mmetsp:Transcript_4447/g.15618  ORF Transcript_4447/g.15618 Transcript_4447/m.15618 type:complete len:284 (-) Transcript_4447:680-1531(-)